MNRKKEGKFVKKCLCLIATLAMVITLLPMTAFAADPKTPITEVTITEVPRPMPGKACSLDNASITTNLGNATSNYVSFWYDDTIGERATGAFIEGHMYHPIFILEPSSIYYEFKFDTSSGTQSPFVGTVTINGEEADEAVQDMEYDTNLFISGKSIKAKSMGKLESVSVELYKYNAIKVSWPKVTGADGYEVLFKRAGMEIYNPVDQTNRTSCIIKGLAAGKKHYVIVAPFLNPLGIYGNSEYGPEKKSAGIYTLKKLNTPKVSKKSSGKVTVRWNNISGETGYQISRSSKKTGTYIVATRYTTTGNYKVLKSKKKKTYYYKVRAFKTVNGKKVFAPWSNVKSYKLK